MVKKSVQSYSLQLFWIVAGFLFAFFIYELRKIGVSEAANKPAIFFISCILVYYSTFKQKKYETQITNIVLGILLFLLSSLFYDLFLTYLHIPQWDFVSFFLFGKVGISHSDFYDPNIFMKFYNTLDLQPRVNGGFIPEIVNVGFWYPPPSMLLFLPLGMFDIQTGYFIWQTIIIVFLIADIFLLVKYFPISINKIYNKNIIIYLSAILVLLFPSILSPMLYSQTISVFLFFLILLMLNLDNWKAGIFLTVLILIKPLAAIFALYFLLFKKWKVLGFFVLSGCTVILVSIFLFGYDSFIIFFKSPPTNRIPPEILYEPTSESLNAILLRLQLRISGYVNFKSIRIVASLLSIIMILITFYSSKMLAKKSNLLSFIIFIPMSLLIYPNTQSFYILLLLPAALYLLIKKPFNNNMLNLALIFFLYAIGHYSLFIIDLILWIILVVWSLPQKYNSVIKPWFDKLDFLLIQNKNRFFFKN